MTHKKYKIPDISHEIHGVKFEKLYTKCIRMLVQNYRRIR